MSLNDTGTILYVEWSGEQVPTIGLDVTTHFHAFIVRQGRADLLLNGEKIRLKTGTGLLVGPGQLMRRVGWTDETRLVEIKVDPYDLFAPALAEQYVTPYMNTSHLTRKQLTPTNRPEKAVLDTIDKVARTVKSDTPFSCLDAALQSTVLWRYWIQQKCEEPPRMTGKDRMTAMLAHIHAHVTHRLTLEQIATAGGLSRAECCRYFTKWCETTPLSYVCDVRMEAAARRLKETSDSVAVIADQFGYSSVSHFVQTFKKVHKVTPLAYRKGKKAN